MTRESPTGALHASPTRIYQLPWPVLKSPKETGMEQKQRISREKKSLTQYAPQLIELLAGESAWHSVGLNLQCAMEHRSGLRSQTCGFEFWFQHF